MRKHSYKKDLKCRKCEVLIWDMSNASGLCKRCWSLSRRHSEETKKKIARLASARFKDPFHWKNHSEGQKKRFANPENHPNWKGGITPQSKKERGGRAYSRFRMDILRRDDFRCQICNVRGGILEIDHIKQWALYPELRYDIDNIRTLCHECHVKTPTYKKVVKYA